MASPGIEPGFSPRQGDVLPLDYEAVGMRLYSNLYAFM
jgi:hypothetical protein